MACRAACDLAHTLRAVQQTSERVVTRCRTTAPVAAPAAVSLTDQALASGLDIPGWSGLAKIPVADM
jgi:hypothetical protein